MRRSIQYAIALGWGLTLALGTPLTAVHAAPADAGAAGTTRTSPAAPADSPARSITFGVLFDGPWPTNEEALERFSAEFARVLGSSVTAEFPEEHCRSAELTRRSVDKEIDHMMNDAELDAVIAFGPLGSQALLELEDPAKPAVAAATLPRALRRGSAAPDGPRSERVVAVELPLRPGPDLTRLDSLFAVERTVTAVPEVYLRELPFLRDAFAGELPDRPQSMLAAVDDAGRFWAVDENAENDGADHDADQVDGTERSVEREELALPNGAELVYLLPMPQLDRAGTRELLLRLREDGLATASALGELEIGSGVTLRMRESHLERMAARAAGEFRDLLRTGSTPQVTHTVRAADAVVADRNALRALGLSPRREALLEVRFVDGTEEASERISLSGAVLAALSDNLDLTAQRLGREADDSRVRRARSNLFPKLDASTTFRAIDEDRAESLFAPDQFSAVAGLELTQVIWSEPARANVKIQRLLADSSTHELEAFEADTVESAAAAYFDLLRTSSLVELRRSDVAQLQFNLARAEARRAVGEAGPEDVYRFRSELALARRELSNAISKHQQATMNLNRILGAPQRRALAPLEGTIEDPVAIMAASEFFLEATDLYRLENIEQKLVRYSLDTSSEVAALRSGIDARMRERRMHSRSFWSPTIAMQARVEHQYWSGGSSADTTVGISAIPTVDPVTGQPSGYATPPATVDAGDYLSTPGDLQWSVGISATIPLTTGGERRARLAETDAELQKLLTEAASARSKIEQRTRTAFVRAAAAAENIIHAREAAAAAADALTLVSRAYEVGVSTAADLVDAQNRATAASKLAQDASYEYLVEFTRMLRTLEALEAIFDPQAQAELEKLFAGLTNTQHGGQSR